MLVVQRLLGRLLTLWIDPGHMTGDDSRPVFAKHMRAHNEKDWKENMDAKWESALAIWLTILEGSKFESNVGRHVKERFKTMTNLLECCALEMPAG